MQFLKAVTESRESRTVGAAHMCPSVPFNDVTNKAGTGDKCTSRGNRFLLFIDKE